MFVYQEKYKNKPWLLEDETGTQYHGHLEGAQSATYYLLMLQGKEFVATPAGSWYVLSRKHVLISMIYADNMLCNNTSFL